MKQLRFLLLALVAVSPLSLLAEGGAHWSEDYAASVKAAKAENKPVIVLFTGSDWCPPCKMMESQVFSSDDFAAFAKDDWVLMMADFPRRSEQDAAIASQNRDLATQFEVRGFPTVFVLSPSGKVLDSFVGAQHSKPADFIAWAKKAAKKS